MTVDKHLALLTEGLEDLCRLYEDQVEEVYKARVKANEAWTNLKGAEKNLEFVESELLLPLLSLGKDGPINGSNETIRKLQIANWLKDCEDYQVASLQVQQAHIEHKQAEANYELAVNRLTLFRHSLTVREAQLRALAAG